MGKTTRFYDPGSGLDGPVSGALAIIPVNFETALTTNAAFYQQVHLPAGMAFEVTDVVAFCGAVTDAPSLTVGTAAAGAQVVAATTLVTGSNVATIVDGTVTAAGMLDVRITNNTTAAIALPISVTLVGHVSAPPTSCP